MSWSFDGTIEKILAALTAVAALMGGGSMIRRRLSRDQTIIKQDQADGARASAESSYFETAIQTITADRDSWRDACERARADAATARVEAAKTMLALERLAGVARAERKLREQQLRVLKIQHPQIDLSWLDSAPQTLGPPETRPGTFDDG